MLSFEHSALRFIVALMLGAAITTSTGCGQAADAGAATAKRTVPVRVASVTVVGESDALRFAGTVRARQRASLTFQVPGVLKERLVELGEQVSGGQVLARLYNPELEPARDAGRARVRELEAQAQQAERDLERAEQLYARGVVSASEREKQRSRLEGLRAAVLSARAAARQTEQLQVESSLRAPFAGRIEAVLVEPGDFIGPGQPVFRLAAEDGLEVEVRVPVSLLGGLETGTRVRVWHSLDGRELVGRIVEIGRGASQGSALYPLIVGLEEGQVRTGEAVEVGLAREQVGGLAIPMAAVMRSAQGLSAFQVKDGRAHRVPVSVRSVQGELALLDEGALQAGDQVVFAGLTRLAEGDSVELLP
jgi:membrane fusion protein, multidrug efflux system